MPSGILTYLASDHNRLESLLDQATLDPARIAAGPYDAFRKGLLRHIGIEEKILFPAIARFQNGVEAVDAGRLRLDHGALVALLVPPPDPAIIRTIRSILEVHNQKEEADAGVYRLLDRLAGHEADKLLNRMVAAPEVTVLPNNPRPEVLEATRRALARAGYRLLEADHD